MFEEIDKLEQRYNDEQSKEILSDWRKEIAKNEPLRKLLEDENVRFLIKLLREEIESNKTELANNRELTDKQRDRIFITIDNLNWFISLFEQAKLNIKRLEDDINKALKDQV